MTGAPRADCAPADFLVHPIAVVSVVALVVNDRFVKQTWPGLVSGKLSDVAGMVFFPLLLVGLVELAAAAARRPWWADRRAFVTVAVIVGAFFGATKVLAPIRAFDEAALGWLRWAPGAAARAATGGAAGAPEAGHVVADATDLVAVPFVIVAVWIGARARRQPDLALPPAREGQTDE